MRPSEQAIDIGDRLSIHFRPRSSDRDKADGPPTHAKPRCTGVRKNLQ